MLVVLVCILIWERNLQTKLKWVQASMGSDSQTVGMPNAMLKRQECSLSLMNTRFCSRERKTNTFDAVKMAVRALEVFDASNAPEKEIQSQISQVHGSELQHLKSKTGHFYFYSGQTQSYKISVINSLDAHTTDWPNQFSPASCTPHKPCPSQILLSARIARCVFFVVAMFFPSR